MRLSHLLALITAGLFAMPVAYSPSAVLAQDKDKKEDKKENKDEPGKKTPANKEPKKVADGPLFEGLKIRLKKHEEEIGKIRQTMLAEIGEEEKQIAEAIQKARDAQKAGDRNAISQVVKLQSRKIQLQQMRFDVERRFQVKGAVDSSLPAELQLGLSTGIPNSTLRAQLGLAKDQGLIVDKVSADSAAAKAGLQQYDILLQVQDKKITSDVFAFRKLLAEIKPGTTVEVLIVRQGKQETIKGLTTPGGAK